MALYSSMEHRQKQKQKQSINTLVIQGVNMLALPSTAMYDYLVELSIGNPMLEIPEPPRGEVYENVQSANELLYIAPGKEPGNYYNDSCAPYTNGDNGQSADPYYAAGEGFLLDGLDGILELQLSMCRLSPLQERIGRDIIGNLDKNGYFAGDLQTICLFYECSQEVGEQMLTTIQSFYPRGIAARNIYEALCLQVEESYPYAKLAKRIITEDLAEIPKGAAGVCAKKYKVSPSCIEEVFEYIKKLEPRPANCDERRFDVSYISPDIVVNNIGGELNVYVSGDGTNPLRLNEEYLDLTKRHDLSSEDELYLRTCLNSARALIHSVDIRRQTIHRAALTIATIQGDFFRYGPSHLRALSMQQMAEAMDVNVSTVSRVVQDKYISCAWGLYPFKYFFARTIGGDYENSAPSTVAKSMIEDIINSEDPLSPITDEQICQRLKQAGFCLSRRTVSKYRQAAGIPGCSSRKQKKENMIYDNL